MTGCAPRSVAVSNPIEIDPKEYSRIYRASIQVLREHRFQLDRQDYRYGRITTRPQPSPTALEPWYDANTTGYQAFESTFNDERRRVTILMDSLASKNGQRVAWDTQPDGGRLIEDGYHLRVEVIVERRQSPRRHLTGSTRGHGVFASLTAAPSELADRGVQNGDYWLPIGRDAYLEQRLLSAIIKKSLTLAQ